MVERDEPLDVHAVGIHVQRQVRKAPEPTAGVDGTVARRRRVLAEVVADLHAVLLGDDLAIQLRVHERNVVSLHVVVGVHLPVRAHLVHEPMAVGERLEGLVGRRVEEGGMVRGQARRVRVEVDEHEAPPLLDAYRQQRELGCIEVVGAEVARRVERAVRA